MSKKMLSNILLLITTMIWGLGFIAQKAAATLGAFTFSASRSAIAALALFIVLYISNRKKGGIFPKETPEDNKLTIKGGIFCGMALFSGMVLQQYGVMYTTVSKAGFITALYVVFVPIIGLLLRKRVRPILWLCVVMGCVGFYFLCLFGETLSLELGDLLVLLCAIGYAVQIMVIDNYSAKTDAVKLSFIQFLTCAVLSAICMLIFDTIILADIVDCILPILYSGIFATTLGYTFQIIGQKHADPTTASLILCLESVFACIFGVIFFKDSMTVPQVIGCILILAASIISNLPEKKK